MIIPMPIMMPESGIGAGDPDVILRYIAWYVLILFLGAILGGIIEKYRDDDFGMGVINGIMSTITLSILIGAIAILIYV